MRAKQLFRSSIPLLVGAIIGGAAATLVFSLYEGDTEISFASKTQKLIPIQVFQQETEYSCGGAVAKAMLKYYKRLGDRRESEINKALKTGMSEENAGTRPENYVAFLKNEGLHVEQGENGTLDLIYHYVNQGIPVLVLDSTWGGHWRLIAGYDFHGNRDRWEDNNLFFVDPEHRTIEPIIDRHTDMTMENESRFYYEWYENRLFDKSREKYYIVAYPQDWNVIPFAKKDDAHSS